MEAESEKHIIRSDRYGGVVLLYNSDTIINDREVILVKRAYSQPGGKGLHFELTDDDVMVPTAIGEEDQGPHTWIIVSAVAG